MYVDFAPRAQEECNRPVEEITAVELLKIVEKIFDKLCMIAVVISGLFAGFININLDGLPTKQLH